MNKTAIILAFILYVVIAIGNIRDKDYPHSVYPGCVWIESTGLSLVGIYKDEMP